MVNAENGCTHTHIYIYIIIYIYTHIHIHTWLSTCGFSKNAHGEAEHSHSDAHLKPFSSDFWKCSSIIGAPNIPPYPPLNRGRSAAKKLVGHGIGAPLGWVRAPHSNRFEVSGTVGMSEISMNFWTPKWVGQLEFLDFLDFTIVS